MRGKRLSERTMGHAKLDMLIDYYLADMQRRGCSDDSVGTNRRALRFFSRSVDPESNGATWDDPTGSSAAAPALQRLLSCASRTSSPSRLSGIPLAASIVTLCRPDGLLGRQGRTGWQSVNLWHWNLLPIT